jgi:hypothetical protein
MLDQTFTQSDDRHCDRENFTENQKGALSPQPSPIDGGACVQGLDQSSDASAVASPEKQVDR